MYPPRQVHAATELRVSVTVSFCAALIGGGDVVSYGCDQHLVPAGVLCALAPIRYAHMDLAWDQPGGVDIG